MFARTHHRPTSPFPASAADEIPLFKDNANLISFIYPAQNKALLGALGEKRMSVFAMDCVPRLLSRAQTFDALTSMANIAGYRAVVEASYEFGRFFAGQVTAAGRIPPAKVLVIGGGIAGLSAVGTAKSLGAIVRAFDTRPSVKEQVESVSSWREQGDRELARSNREKKRVL